LSDNEKNNRPPWWLRFLPQAVGEKIGNSTGLLRILNNSGWLFFERIFRMGAAFLVAIWLIRYLGPEAFGKYSYAASFVGLLTVFAGLGLDSIVVRNLVGREEERGAILGTALAIRLAAAIVTYALTVTLVYLVNDDRLIRLMVIVIAGQLVTTPFLVIDHWFQSQVQSKYVVWVKSFSTVIILAARVSFILLEFPVVYFAGVLLAENIIVAIGLVVVYRLRNTDKTRWQVRATLAREMLADSWPLIVTGLSVSIYLRIDQVMLEEMVGSASVGIYAAAVRFSEIWYFIPTAIAASVFPAVVRTRESGDLQLYAKRMQALYDVMTALGYLIVLPLAFFAVDIISLLYGEQYIEAGSIMRVHIFAFIFVCLGMARSQWLLAENFTRFAMISTGFGAITNLALNLWLIPKYGGLGAAWATLISYAVAGYFSSVATAKVRLSFKQQTLSLLLPFRFRTFMKSLNDIF
jgi:O-antigen/teichoic acid export membrane protein